MKVTEIRERLARLDWLEWHLRQEYEETGGEVTDSTECQEEEAEIIRELLSSPETIDELGRWLVQRQELEEIYRAEAEKITRNRKANKETIDYIKRIAGACLRARKKELAKGTLYSFKQSVSDTCVCDNKVLEADWLIPVQQLVKDQIPDYIQIKLTGSVTKAKELDELPQYFERTVTPTSSFVKPRKSKKQEE